MFGFCVNRQSFFPHKSACKFRLKVCHSLVAYDVTTGLTWIQQLLMVSKIKVLRNSVGYVHFTTANSHPHSRNTELLLGHMRRCVEEFQFFDVKQESPRVCIPRHGAHSYLVKLSQDFVTGNGTPGASSHSQEYYRREENPQNSAKSKIFIKNNKVTCEFYVFFFLPCVLV